MTTSTPVAASNALRSAAWSEAGNFFRLTAVNNPGYVARQSLSQPQQPGVVMSFSSEFAL